jgi:hypothetical protein
MVESIVHLAKDNYIKAIELIERSEATELRSENVYYLCAIKSTIV